MPKLDIYNAKGEINAEPLAKAAQVVGIMGNMAGNSWEQGFRALGQGVSKFMDKNDRAANEAAADEMMNATADMATHSANFEVQWKQFLKTQDGTNPNAADDWIAENVDKPLAEAGGQYKSDKARRYWQKEAARRRSHIYTTAHADMANVEAQTAVDNLGKTGAGYSVAAAANPLSWQEQITGFEGAIDEIASTYHLSVDQVRDQKEKQGKLIVDAAINSMMKENPKFALEKIDAGEFDKYLDGKEKVDLQDRAKKAIEAHEQDAKNELSAAETARKKEAETKLSELQATFEFDEQTGKYVIPPGSAKALNDIANDYKGAISPDQIRAAQNFIAEKSKGVKVDTDDKGTYESFVRRASEGTLTMGDIYNANAAGKLSDDHLGFFKGWITSTKEDGKKIDGINGLIDSLKGYIAAGDLAVSSGAKAVGNDLFYQFKTAAMDYATEQRKAGKTEKEIEQGIRDMVVKFNPTEAEATQLSKAPPIRVLDDFVDVLHQQEQPQGGTTHPDTTSAWGPFQIVKGTWDMIASNHPELGLTEEGYQNVNSPQHRAAIMAFTRDNADKLIQNNLPVTGKNLYMMHFLGSGDAPIFIFAAQNTPQAVAAEYVQPESVTANPNVFFERDGNGNILRAKSVAEVYANQTRKFSGTEIDMPAQPGESPQDYLARTKKAK